MAMFFTSQELLDSNTGKSVLSKNVEPSTEDAQKLDENYQRIRKNVQKMVDAEWSADKIREYLKREKVEFDFDTPMPKPVEDTTPKSLGVALVQGGLKGVVGFGTLPLMAGELLGSAVRKIVSEKVFDTPATFSTPLTNTIMQGVDVVNIAIDPEESLAKTQKVPTDALFQARVPIRETETSFANRAAEKVGEYVAPGALITKGLTILGAKLVKESPDILKWWQRLAVEVSKNPTKIQAIEAGLNSLTAVAGEQAATVLNSTGNPKDAEFAEYARFGTEIGTIFGTVWATRAMQRLGQVATKRLTLTDGMRRRAAEDAVADVFNDLMEHNPQHLQSVAAAEQLEKAIPGISFTTPDTLQIPELQAAFNRMLQTGDVVASRYGQYVDASRARLDNFRKEIQPLLHDTDNIQTGLSGFLERKFKDLDKRIALVERKAAEEVELMHPARSPDQIGESALQRMKVLENEAYDSVDALYAQIPDDVDFPVTHIRGSIELARRAQGTKGQLAVRNVKRATFDQPEIGPKGKVANFGDLNNRHGDLLEFIDANFGKDVKRADMATLREYRKLLVHEERIARLHGNADSAQRIKWLVRGVDRQFDAARKPLSQNASKVLKEANKQWHAVHQRFDTAYDRLRIQQDLSGMYRLAPEDFGRKFIHPSSSNGHLQVVKDFKQIFGDDEIAKELITNSVAYQLSKLVDNSGSLNIARVQSWLQRHKPNLKAHGIWEQFKDVGSAAQRAKKVIADATVDRRLYERGVIQGLAKADDPVKFMATEINSGRIATTMREIRQTGNRPAIRGATRAVWDAVIRRSGTRNIDSAEQLIRKPDELLVFLSENESTLRKALGRKHYENLQTYGRGLKKIEGSIDTFGAHAGELAQDVMSKEMIENKVVFTIRRLLQGWVSRQFTAVEFARLGLNVFNTKVARNVLEEAMFDPKYAQELVTEFRRKQALPTLRLLFTPAIAPLITDMTTQELVPDERYEF